MRATRRPGSLKQLDPRIVAKRPLDIILYGLGHVEGASPYRQHSDVLGWLKPLGFRTRNAPGTASPPRVVDAIEQLDKIRRSF